MLNFNLTPEQMDLQKSVRQFALDELLPVAWYFDEKNQTRQFVDIDTILENYHIYKYPYLYTYAPLFLGNIGQPGGNQLFFNNQYL